MLVLSYSRYTKDNNNNNHYKYISSKCVEKIDNLFLNKTPIWFMRQAGRYLPEYRKLREHKGSFLRLCFDPKAAAEVSLQPLRRFDIDFIILFSDILVIPLALGQKLDFIENEGPILGELPRINELMDYDLNFCIQTISKIFETIEILERKKQQKKLIGFCGGPFTVMNYMIERGTSKTHQKILKFIRQYPQKSEKLVKIIQDISVLYLLKQIESGVDLIKVFDSWAGLLSKKEYEKYIIKPSIYINEKVKQEYPTVPRIFFPRGSGANIISFIEQVDCNVLAIDENYPQKLKDIAREKNIILQGNLSPTILAEGGEKMEREIKQILFDFKKNKHIFNLSHGVLPNTPVKNITTAIEIVRENEFNKRTS